MTCLQGFQISVIYFRLPYVHAVEKHWQIHSVCRCGMYHSAVNMNVMPHCLVKGFLEIMLH